MKTMALILVLAVTVMTEARGQDVAITGVRAHPVSSGVIENATILVRDGLITAIGAQVLVPEGVPVMDGTNLDAWPGFIDGWTTLGLSEIGQVASTVDTSEMGDWQAHLRAASAVNPHSAHIPVARVNGITMASVVPSSGLIGGEIAILQLYGRTVTEMTVKAATPLRALRIPSPGRRDWSAKQAKGYWKKAEKKWKKVEDYLKRAREVSRFLAEGVVEFEGVEDGQARLSLVATARHLAAGNPWLVRVDDRDHILAALKFARKHDLRLILAGLRDAWQVVDDIKGTKHKLLVGSVFSSPGQDEPYDAAYANAAVLHRAGLEFGFMSGSSSGVRNLPYIAAMAASHGLPHEATMRALTLGCAEALGLGKTYGSLYPGKAANIVLYDGDPLDARISPKHIFIQGRRIPLASRHTELANPFLPR